MPAQSQHFVSTVNNYQRLRGFPQGKSIALNGVVDGVKPGLFAAAWK